MNGQNVLFRCDIRVSCMCTSDSYMFALVFYANANGKYMSNTVDSMATKDAKPLYAVLLTPKQNRMYQFQLGSVKDQYICMCQL